MECNREEAARAKEIGERKLLEKDVAGARKFALKAQSLYPGLEGLSQFLAILEVYLSSEKIINGVHDYYGILGVVPSADEDTIRKHYRRLALVLHPDKNKYAGADGAFKIISEAWSMLSNPSKKNIYDQKRNFRSILQNVSMETPSVPARKNDYCNSTSSRATQKCVRTKKDAAKPNGMGQQSAANGVSPQSATNGVVPQSATNGVGPQSSTNGVGPQSATNGLVKQSVSCPINSPAKVSDGISFWTVCTHCEMQYEYHRKYLNRTLLCLSCQKPFRALEMSPPPTGSLPWKSNQQGKNSTNTNLKAAPKKPVASPNVQASRVPGVDSSNANSQSGVFSKTVGSKGRQATSVPSTAQAAGPFQQPNEPWNKIQEEAYDAYLNAEADRKIFQAFNRAAGLEALRKKSREVNKAGSGLANGASALVSGSAIKRSIDEIGNRETNMGYSQPANFETVRHGFSPSVKKDGSRDLSQSENRNMLLKKARMEISKAMDEWSMTESTDSAKNYVPLKKKKDEKKKVTENVVKNGVDLAINEPVEAMLMSVPDSDFYDFDKDRTEESFTENQIWAAYDNDDGMPRFYALINAVESVQPFKMRISWLNSKSNNELAPINWVSSGFTKTCGDLHIGKRQLSTTLNAFSHEIKWKKGLRGVIQIYPKKGDVWALYKNWTPDWDMLTPVEVVHQYEMVEVLEDYDEERGVTVAPLVKVAGFRTIFHQHLNPDKFKNIKKEELFRFSHQVPSHLLTGQEGPGSLKGCRELDPASTPMELQNVIPVAKDDEGVVHKSENGGDDLHKNAGKTEM